VLAYGIYLSPEITTIMAFMTVFLVLLPLLFTHSIDRKNFKLSEANDRYMADVKDVLSGYSSVKVYNAEQVMKRRVNKSCGSVYDANNRKDGILVTLSTLTSLTGNSVKLLLVIVAAIFVANGRFDVGTITAILTLSGSFYSPVMDLSGLIGSMIGTKAVRMKLARIFKHKPEPMGLSAPIGGDIRLTHINFTYDNQRPILKDVSYTFQRNRKYLIIGASGCGKSTLLRLIAMLNECQSGSISMGEFDYNQINFASLIREVTYVQQKEFLFDSTLRQNIDLSSTGDTEKIQYCVKMCKLEELISKMPRGLDTPVNEEMDRISEGEKLRIVLARALYKGGSVYLFDEVTSSLDNVNSREIEDMILKLDATVLSICHRIDPELMCRYDNILVMEDGRIVQSGTYEQLKDAKEIKKYLLKQAESKVE
jgi:ATP-binding cassette subfamily C protein